MVIPGSASRETCERCFVASQAWDVRPMSDARPVQFEVFTYVVVLQATDGRVTVPVTLCAQPADAERVARVIAYLELSALGRGATGRDPFDP